MFEDSLYWLDQIRTSHRVLVGDKAFYLGLLAQRGCPVIPGFVISAAVFQAFLEQIEWTEPMFADLPYSSLHVDVDNSRQLQSVAQQIRQTLEAAPFPDAWLPGLEQAIQPWSGSTVILRPSIALPSGYDPTVSLNAVGFLESRVCQANAHELTQSLKQVWAELFRAKSLLYWQRLRIQPQQVNLGVLVQPIANAIASGELQIHETHLEVRAIWGLGRALTNGQVLPDYYQVDLQTGLHTYRPTAKLYAYQLAASADRSASLPQTDSGYQTIAVAPMQQTQPVLTEAQLRHLIQLAQQTASDLGLHLGLEWTLMDKEINTSLHLKIDTKIDTGVNAEINIENSSPYLYLTQLTPHLRLGRWEHEPRKLNHPETQTSSVHPKAEASPQSISCGDATRTVLSPSPAETLREQSLVLSPQSSALPLITGLAAAPGTIAASAWVSQQSIPSQFDLPTGMILVAPQITPDWLPWMKQAAAIITEQGGMTSHGAVLAREIGIPAITGAINATQIIHTGDNLWVDGDRGEVHRVEDAGQEAEGRGQKAEGRRQEMPLLSPSPPSSLIPHPSSFPPLATQLFVTLSQPDAITRVKDLPIDGVGLLRSELMMLEALEQRHPDAWVQQGQQVELTDRLAQQIQQFAQAFAPRPVFYRSADLRSHEFSHLQGLSEQPEPNPMLGLRGTLRYQVEPALFAVELAALRQVQQQGYSNVHLLLPFVRTVEEFSFCQQRIQQAGLAENPLFQLWIMAEVPSVLLLLPDYIRAGVQGIAIGSSDLTQLLLGVDRDQSQMATAFNPLHPAVMRAMQQLIQTAQQSQIPCSVCGQAPGQYPEMIEALVRWGITAISVNANEVMAVRDTIARTEHRLLLEAARQQLGERSGLA